MVTETFLYSVPWFENKDGSSGLMVTAAAVWFQFPSAPGTMAEKNRARFSGWRIAAPFATTAGIPVGTELNEIPAANKH